MHTQRGTRRHTYRTPCKCAYTETHTDSHTVSLQMHTHRDTHRHTYRHTNTHKRRKIQKETRGHSSNMHGNGWVEWGQLRNCIEEWLRSLDRRVDSYHAQVNTHMHRVTHIQNACKSTHTQIYTHKDNTDKDNTHL